MTTFVKKVETGVYPKEFYSISEVCSIFSLGYSTVLRMCRFGKIKAIRIGKNWRIPSFEVVRMAKGMSV